MNSRHRGARNRCKPTVGVGGPPLELCLNLASPQTTIVLGLPAVNSLRTIHLSGWLVSMY